MYISIAENIAYVRPISLLIITLVPPAAPSPILDFKNGRMQQHFQAYSYGVYGTWLKVLIETRSAHPFSVLGATTLFSLTVMFVSSREQ